MGRNGKMGLASALDALRDANTRMGLLEDALSAAAVETPDAVRKIRREDGCFTRIQLYRPASPSGGIVVVTDYTKSSRPYVHAHYLDDALAEAQRKAAYLPESEDWRELRRVYSELTAERDRLAAVRLRD